MIFENKRCTKEFDDRLTTDMKNILRDKRCDNGLHSPPSFHTRFPGNMHVKNNKE